LSTEYKGTGSYIIEEKKKSLQAVKYIGYVKGRITPFYASRSPQTHFLTHLSFAGPASSASPSPGYTEQGIIPIPSMTTGV
jgi:hypothetical protein